ncbi:MAG TPA: hypothetical protein PK200_18935 [Spirochaetota bacterium]|nr:hypothetical protein [Spirochaetota bacterium]HQP49052.1 hypothetical protein [Spirochaetota bacterium]
MRYSIITLLCAVIITAGCSSVSINNTEKHVSETMLEQQIGLISIEFQDPGDTYFNFIMKNTREGIIEDSTKSLAEKNKIIAGLQDFNYISNRYFLFRIRHTKPVHREKGAAKFTFVDAVGSDVIAKMVDTTVKWSGDGTMYEQCFIFKTVRPVTAENFSKKQLPLTFTAEFMGTQKMVYTVTP